MDIISPHITADPFLKNQMEMVQREQKEKVLLGSFSRTRGLALFEYIPDTGKIRMIKPVVHGMKVIFVIKNGKLEVQEAGITGHVTVDSLDMVFETLNMRSAQKRVDRWKEGKIATLSNLRAAVKALHYTDFV